MKYLILLGIIVYVFRGVIFGPALKGRSTRNTIEDEGYTDYEEVD